MNMLQLIGDIYFVKAAV